MYINKCTKCGAEFETKNPKRVICPNCLYPDKKPVLKSDSQETPVTPSETEKPVQRASYSSGGDYSAERRPYRSDDSQHRSYNRPYEDRPHRPQGDRPYNRPQGDRPYNNYNRPYDRPQGDRPYNRPPQGDRPYNRPYDRPQGDRPYNRPQGDRPYNRPYDRPQGDRPYNRPPQGDRPYNNYNRGDRPQRPGGFNRGGSRPQRPKQLLVSKEQLEQIEILYKKTLPLPNPDIHEVIGGAIDLEPRKVFFGINLVRQKMMLPKLPFPKRKLAVSPDQLFAIKSLYEPLLPLPPIGCHKIIAAQLKMDEWRVHVGIGLVRKQMGLDRWNPDRPDAPAEFKK